MKAEIDATGTLTISSETPLEAYALSQWIRQAAIDGTPGTISTNHLIVDASLRPRSDCQ